MKQQKPGCRQHLPGGYGAESILKCKGPLCVVQQESDLPSTLSDWSPQTGEAEAYSKQSGLHLPSLLASKWKKEIYAFSHPGQHLLLSPVSKCFLGFAALCMHLRAHLECKNRPR